MNELIKKIQIWSASKGLHEAQPEKQMLKVVEEIGEVAAGLARGNHEAIKDGIGDSFVTLIILCQQLRTTPEECLEMAYEAIKNRQGKTVNGIFVKQEDIK